MARKHTVYVTQNWRKKWVVRISGKYDTQASAELVGRSIASVLGTEFEVRGRDGRIRKKDSFGSDPRDIPG